MWRLFTKGELECVVMAFLCVPITLSCFMELASAKGRLIQIDDCTINKAKFDFVQIDDCTINKVKFDFAHLHISTTILKEINVVEKILVVGKYIILE